VGKDQPFVGWPFGRRAREAAKTRLRDLIAQERNRARLHIQFIRQSEPVASNDRVAHILVERWSTVAAVEGGLTGAFGLIGVPLNLLLVAYFQLALVVSIAEAYDVGLEGDTGEEAILSVIGRAHGVEDMVRASPRLLGELAKALALRHGLGTLGRLVPLAASPISAKLNQRDMGRIGGEALRRFGGVIDIRHASGAWRRDQ
jgi:hypothetical protein